MSRLSPVKNIVPVMGLSDKSLREGGPREAHSAQQETISPRAPRLLWQCLVIALQTGDLAANAL